MTNAIRVHRSGGPQELQWECVDLPPPGPGEVRLKHDAIGLNFIDVYHRTGLYPQPLPFIPGVEGAGTVEAVGSDLSGLTVGDRVAYALELGAYADSRLIDADRLARIPPNISAATAAAVLLKGLTAQFLLRRTYEVKPDDTILVHAAAGGVGLILCQLAKAIGATVIGTVSTLEKAELCRAHGCDHPLVTSDVDFVEAVRDLTDGVGVPVVYDSVGRDTFTRSLKCLRPFGLMVLFGQSSGRVEAVDPNVLQSGSLMLTRPTLATHAADRNWLAGAAEDLFGLVGSGQINVSVNQAFRLEDAALAHHQLETRLTTGSTILVPRGADMGEVAQYPGFLS